MAALAPASLPALLHQLRGLSEELAASVASQNSSKDEPSSSSYASEKGTASAHPAAGEKRLAAWPVHTVGHVLMHSTGIYMYALTTGYSQSVYFQRSRGVIGSEVGRPHPLPSFPVCVITDGTHCWQCLRAVDLDAWATSLQQREATLMQALCAWKLLETSEVNLAQRERDVHFIERQCAEAQEKTKAKLAAFRERCALFVGYLSAGPIEGRKYVCVTSACARRTGAAARVEHRRRER